MGKSFLDGGSRVGLAEAECMMIDWGVSQDGGKNVCSGEQGSESSVSVICGGNLDQLRGNWLLSKNTQQFGAVAQLPVLICVLPVMMNNDLMRYACFKATIDPLTFIAAHR
jgi:hypothetical protein